MEFLKDKALIKMVSALAAVGFIISLMASLIAGVSFLTLFFRAILFTVLMGALGAVIFFVFSSFIPEINETLRGDSSFPEDPEYSPEGEDGTTEPPDYEPLPPDETADMNRSESDLSGMDSGSKEANYSATRKKQEAKEGHIMVEGYSIKNEPAVMADAIRHLLEQDKD